MKILTVLPLLLFFLFSCNTKDSEATKEQKVGDFIAYGESISPDGAISQEEMLAKYQNLQLGDTIDIKFSSKVESVCQMKGCWVKLELDPDTKTMVKFKDYDFVVPKDSEGNTAIVEGRAYISELSKEDLQHYAKDAGKTDEDIAAITKGKTDYEFIADGVLLKD